MGPETPADCICFGEGLSRGPATQQRIPFGEWRAVHLTVVLGTEAITAIRGEYGRHCACPEMNCSA